MQWIEYKTHSIVSLVQFPMKSGIFPVKLLPSIRLKAVLKDEKFPDSWTINLHHIKSLTKQLSSSDFQMILVLNLKNCLQKEDCRSKREG